MVVSFDGRDIGGDVAAKAGRVTGRVRLPLLGQEISAQ
jgi:hypothetical protein